MGSSYGGAFSNVPERVGSAPATDITVVRNNFIVKLLTLEICQFWVGVSVKQKQTLVIWDIRTSRLYKWDISIQYLTRVSIHGRTDEERLWSGFWVSSDSKC